MLHDTDALVAALQSGHLGGAGLDHFEGEHLAPDHPLCAMHNVVLTPHIGGATYDTEANHSKLIADDVAPHPARREAGQLREPGGTRLMAGLKGTAEEIKADLLWVAQESLRTNLVHGTAGNFSARLPDGNVVLTPSSLDVRDDDARRPRRVRPRRQRGGGHARPDDREDAAPRVPEGVRRHPRGRSTATRSSARCSRSRTSRSRA